MAIMDELNCPRARNIPDEYYDEEMEVVVEMYIEEDDGYQLLSARDIDFKDVEDDTSCIKEELIHVDDVENINYQSLTEEQGELLLSCKTENARLETDLQEDAKHKLDDINQENDINTVAGSNENNYLSIKKEIQDSEDDKCFVFTYESSGEENSVEEPPNLSLVKQEVEEFIATNLEEDYEEDKPLRSEILAALNDIDADETIAEEQFDEELSIFEDTTSVSGNNCAEDVKYVIAAKKVNINQVQLESSISDSKDCGFTSFENIKYKVAEEVKTETIAEEFSREAVKQSTAIASKCTEYTLSDSMDDGFENYEEDCSSNYEDDCSANYEDDCSANYEEDCSANYEDDCQVTEQAEDKAFVPKTVAYTISDSDYDYIMVVEDDKCDVAEEVKLKPTSSKSSNTGSTKSRTNVDFHCFTESADDCMLKVEKEDKINELASKSIALSYKSTQNQKNLPVKNISPTNCAKISKPNLLKTNSKLENITEKRTKAAAAKNSYISLIKRVYNFYKCIICLKCCNTVTETEKHIQQSHCDSEYICQECDMLFMCPKLIQMHMSKHIIEAIADGISTSISFQMQKVKQDSSANEMPKVFVTLENNGQSSAKQLKSISKRTNNKLHNNDYEKYICRVDKYYRCSLCPNRRMLFPETLIKHIKLSHLGYRYKCNECEVYYLKESTLREHLVRLHNKDDSGPFTLEIPKVQSRLS